MIFCYFKKFTSLWTHKNVRAYLYVEFSWSNKKPQNAVFPFFLFKKLDFQIELRSNLRSFSLPDFRIYYYFLFVIFINERRRRRSVVVYCSEKRFQHNHKKCISWLKMCRLVAAIKRNIMKKWSLRKIMNVFNLH